MAINPDENKIESLGFIDEHEPEDIDNIEKVLAKMVSKFVRPDGSPIPAHWPVMAVGEHVVVKNYTFAIAHFGEKHVLLEPVGPTVVGEGDGQ